MRTATIYFRVNLRFVNRQFTESVKQKISVKYIDTYFIAEPASALDLQMGLIGLSQRDLEGKHCSELVHFTTTI